MARIHNVENVEKHFEQFAGITLTEDREVIILSGTTTLGNKSWGKVDFLVNYCGYRLVR